MNNYQNYQNTRLKFDKRRKIVWQEVSKYLQKWIPENSVIADIGSGYCDFINTIKAKKKFAIDAYINPKDYCNCDIKSISADYKKLKKLLKNNSIDVFLMSNFLEHLTKEECSECLDIIKEKLKNKGRLILIQPNYRLCAKNYFDDYTHKSIWSDESMKDFLKTKGFKIIKINPKFLPFSMKSKFPASKILIRSYLHSPFKPFGKQMLIIAEVNKNVER